ncbi:MAG: ParB/RepB/Spo0J family partition protein [Clostridia bacterium]|nr:ParB/RepB/Spo0J family partition protein [Clostridia bacterium]
MHTISEKKLLLLRPGDILPSPDQPRKRFDEQELDSLAKSISANGIIEPLCVRRDGRDKYVLISGERRLRAAKIAGLRRIPCVVHKTDDKSAALFTLTENIQREDLDFFEEAAAIDRLLAIYGISATEMAARLGMAQSTLSNKLRLLRIDRLDREKIIAANLSERHARALLRLNKNDIPSVIDTVISRQLSVRETEELVCAIVSPKKPEPQKEPVRKAAIGDIKIFSNSLSRLLTTMQNSGIEASSSRRETDDYVEFEVRIEKNTTHQLAIAGI